jgi:signal transduction histidine kinase
LSSGAARGAVNFVSRALRLEQRPARRGSDPLAAGFTIGTGIDSRMRGRASIEPRPIFLAAMRVKKASLRSRLFGVWLLSLLACIAIGVLLVQLYRQSTAARVGRADAVIARACDLIRDRYDLSAAAWSGAAPTLSDKLLRAALAGAVARALARQNGVEGGVWQAEAGALAYAFPTYPGTGPKTDLPAAEREHIQAANIAADRDRRPVDRRSIARGQTLLLYACPLSGPIPRLTAWTMTRVEAAPEYGRLRLGLAVLFGFMVLISAWLGRTLIVWTRHIRGIEAALGGAGADGMPTLAPTGERELDRVIAALNEAGMRLAEARRQSEALAARVARAERLAGLGRLAAGVAHEIRNPIAAARLQGENGLAGDEARCRAAIGDMLGQIDRLDDLVAELLAATQRVAPHPVPVELAAFLAARAAACEPTASARGVAVAVMGEAGTALFDPAMVGRILDNLLANAIRHAPEGGAVTLAARRDRDELTITVEDTGRGVPSHLAERLFEPFVTGRAEGTGLGLAIARELADAHGGRLELRRAGGSVVGEGAVFALYLPQEGKPGADDPDRR